MKICVLGLDCAAPDILFQNPRLKNIRKLMERGAWGKLESVIPPITVPAWMCLATSQDPGSLGVYGFRNRTNRSYSGLAVADSASIQAPAIWDYLGTLGKRSIVIGVPPGYPPRKIEGISVGCFLTPDPSVNEFTHPPEIKREINQLVGSYPTDVTGFRTENKAWLRDQIFEMNRKQWQVVHHFLANKEWDYFQFVDIGLDRIHHGFWDCYDKHHIHYHAGNPYENVIPDYYELLDDQVGKALDLLDKDTAVLLVSDHGAQRLDGGFAVNQWLIEQGWLVLNQEMPREITPFSNLRIDWARTRVWSEGGYYARIFMNVKGREPVGVISASEYEPFRDEVKQKFLAMEDKNGQPLNSLVFKPEEIYRNLRNVAPDLIVHLGGLYWRSIGSVGHRGLYVEENDTGPDACNHAQFGAFILQAPNQSVRGKIEGARLLDMMPTLLKLAGYEVPETMQGHPIQASTLQ